MTNTSAADQAKPANFNCDAIVSGPESEPGEDRHENEESEKNPGHQTHLANKSLKKAHWSNKEIKKMQKRKQKNALILV